MTISNYDYYQKQETWVNEYGSSRLFKALKANMLDRMKDVYEQERIKQEFGDKYEFWPKNADSYYFAENVTEEQLDALLSFDPKLKPELRWICFPKKQSQHEPSAEGTFQRETEDAYQRLAVVFQVNWTDTRIVSYLDKLGLEQKS